MATSIDQGDHEEPAGWFLAMTERRFARLGERGWEDSLPKVEAEELEESLKELREKEREKGEDQPPDGREDDDQRGRRVFSFFEPGVGRESLADLKPDYFQELRGQYIERLKRQWPESIRRKDPEWGRIPEAGVPGANNWVPIGPSVVLRGQASGNPPVGGRTTGIAVAPGGLRVYAASADGGVWRSDDGGNTWNPMMNGFDVNPTSFGSTSNACGAVAIDQAAPDRVYVGTGEADTWGLWTQRITSALPSYHGVGMIRSDDGGVNWNQEPVAPGDPTLAGQACFALAVDPANRENVVAATTGGLYQRVSDGSGGWMWRQRRTGVHSSVVVCRTTGTGAATTFIAARWGGNVFSSSSGNTWAQVGNAFPATATRISLAVQPTNPNIVYGFYAGGSSFGLARLDNLTGSWANVSSLPSLGSQFEFNLPIAIDSSDANTIYLGGSARFFGGEWTATIFRCAVSVSGSAYSLANTYIGAGVHPDVHVLVLQPDNNAFLWTGTDGGLARNSAATSSGSFVHRNTGYATLCVNFFSQHPTEPALVLCGLQDNGSARYTGEEAWLHVGDGDGGYPVINWANPRKMMIYANGSVSVATDGGQSVSSFSPSLSPPWVIMAEPIVTTPYNPGSSADADTVAFGAGGRLYITTNFGTSWPIVDTLSENIFALCFASASRLFVGTTAGKVYRYDLSAGTWSSTRIDNASGGALGVTGLLTDICVDPTNSNRIWVTFGGIGDWRHIWHYNGSAWSVASGPSSGHANALLDNSHNAIVATSASQLYVGADVGVWQSADGGANWSVMSAGLPDAAVMDLRLHPTDRLLRAGTHGRGMFEYKLDPPIQSDTEVYLRDTSVDVAREPTVDFIQDPETWPNVNVRHWKSRNIKVDPQTPSGYQTPTTDIDFVQFNDVIVDASDGVVTQDPSVGTVVNRVYVEVHNRGIVKVDTVRVMLLLANSSAGLPNLPSGYTANVTSGTAISTSTWETVGIQNVSDLRNHLPQVLEFDLPSTMLPPPASLPGQSHHCLLALAHSAQDTFISTNTDTDAVTVADRKIAQRNVNVIAFPPGPSTGPGAWVWSRVELHGLLRRDTTSELLFDARRFPGDLAIVFPPELLHDMEEKGERADIKFTQEWAERHSDHLHRFLQASRYHAGATEQMLEDVKRLSKSAALMLHCKEKVFESGELHLKEGQRYPVFVAFRLPKGADPEAIYEVNAIEATPRKRRVLGGVTWKLFTDPGSEAQLA